MANDTETVMVPAVGRSLQGILRRREILKLLGTGLSNNQICGELDISSQALNRHLRIIAAEDARSA